MLKLHWKQQGGTDYEDPEKASKHSVINVMPVKCDLFFTVAVFYRECS